MRDGSKGGHLRFGRMLCWMLAHVTRWTDPSFTFCRASCSSGNWCLGGGVGPLLDGCFDVGLVPLWPTVGWAACCCILKEQVKGRVVASIAVLAHASLEGGTHFVGLLGCCWQY